MTVLESRIQRRLHEWRRLAESYRRAQRDCEPSEPGWQLNKESADTIERLSAELREDWAASKAIKRSQYEPVR